jgi:hypothetical protein
MRHPAARSGPSDVHSLATRIGCQSGLQVFPLVHLFPMVSNLEFVGKIGRLLRQRVRFSAILPNPVPT